LYRHPVRLAEIQQQQNKAAGVPIGDPSTLVDQDQANEDFLIFFEDLFVELSKFGRIEGLHVVENLGDHLIGKYIRYLYSIWRV
jgi:splicing factor U2AF 35 kDa subunit